MDVLIPLASNVSLILDPETQNVTVDNPNPTIPVLWQRAALDAVISGRPGPTIASRAYGIVATAMFDAWSAYDQTAISTRLGDDLQRPDEENTEANKSEAISYAAYQVLVDLFPTQKPIFDQLMTDLGFDPTLESTDPTTAAGVGNIVAQELIDFRQQDGSNQLNGYVDTTGYTPVNSGPDNVLEIDRWTPEFRVSDDTTSGLQSFLTPQWGSVTPFSDEEDFTLKTPEPFLLVEGSVSLAEKTITLADGTVLPITPDLVGTVINPKFIQQAEDVVKYSAQLTDKQKLIAEFWENGGGSPFPPGTWVTFGEYVSARDSNSLDDDVKLFFKLGNAVLDAGIQAWDAKIETDYVRPVRGIRALGELGLIGTFDPEVGENVIRAYDRETQTTQVIPASQFVTYQGPQFGFSPPFAEFVSGHSTFSAAAAQVLKAVTGSDHFGGTVLFQPGESRFEPGITPNRRTRLSWNTFTDGSNEAGISRRFGGIHFLDGDLQGRLLGRRVGQAVLEQADFYINGGEDLTEAQTLIGTKAADIFAGTSKGDRIVGLAGDDILAGGGGDDLVLGGRGADQLFGDSGNDVLIGGGGQDLVIGGDGADEFVLAKGLNSDVIQDFEDGIDLLRVTGVRDFSRLAVVESGADTLIQSARNGAQFAVLKGVDSSLITVEDFIFSSFES